MMPRRRKSGRRSLAGVLAAVIVLVIVGVAAQFGLRIPGFQEQMPGGSTAPAMLGGGAITPAIVLDVAAGAPEAVWTASLAERLGGKAEASVEFGRVDVLTETYAIEIDFLKKWKEGVGQALHYAKATGRTPCLALIAEGKDADAEQEIAYVDKLCLEQGIKLVLLMRSGGQR